MQPRGAIPFSLPASCQLICILPRGKGTRICIRALTLADLTVLERAPYSSSLNFTFVGKNNTALKEFYWRII